MNDQYSFSDEKDADAHGSGIKSMMNFLDTTAIGNGNKKHGNIFESFLLLYVAKTAVCSCQ